MEFVPVFVMPILLTGTPACASIAPPGAGRNGFEHTAPASLSMRGENNWNSGNRNSVLTAGSKDRENPQIGVVEHAALDRFSRLHGGAHDRAQVLAASQVAQVFGTDAGQAGNFFF